MGVTRHDLTKSVIRRNLEQMTPDQRLTKIAAIIEDVDYRAMHVDGPVTPTLQEMTQREMSAIYWLASGRVL